MPDFPLIVLAVASALGIAATALAADYDPSAPLDVSAGLSLAGCTAGASAEFASVYDVAEVEPQVAVNPLNPLEMIGASQQDRWPDGGARGLTSWISHHGRGLVVEAAGCALERLSGRAEEVRTGDRPVGVVRGGG